MRLSESALRFLLSPRHHGGECNHLLRGSKNWKITFELFIEILFYRRDRPTENQLKARYADNSHQLEKRPQDLKRPSDLITVKMYLWRWTGDGTFRGLCNGLWCFGVLDVHLVQLLWPLMVRLCLTLFSLEWHINVMKCASFIALFALFGGQCADIPLFFRIFASQNCDTINITVHHYLNLLLFQSIWFWKNDSSMSNIQ